MMEDQGQPGVCRRLADLVIPQEESGTPGACIAASPCPVEKNGLFWADMAS